MNRRALRDLITRLKHAGMEVPPALYAKAAEAHEQRKVQIRGEIDVLAEMIPPQYIDMVRQLNNLYKQLDN